MATEKHKQLSQIIKFCHENLRQMSKLQGPECAWDEHLKNTEALKEYANAMHELANIWEENSENVDSLASSRIKWTIDYCLKYFYTDKIMLEKRKKELRQLESWTEFDSSKYNILDDVNEYVKVLDVGSCFNPFRETNIFQVTAIDVQPANDTVYYCDFLNVSVRDMDEPRVVFDGNKVVALPTMYFECVVFSLLLEYIPSSQQRMKCCRTAYNLLKYEGILIIITPDSQHVGKNAMLMKNWRYTLATLGFTRTKFEKLPHITCMAFRKASNPEIAYQWAELHRENYMTLSIDIPQDNK